MLLVDRETHTKGSRTCLPPPPDHHGPATPNSSKPTPWPWSPNSAEPAQVLLQSGGNGVGKLITPGVPDLVALVFQALAKALATITASGFGCPKANTVPCPLRSACIASIPCNVR